MTRRRAIVLLVNILAVVLIGIVVWLALRPTPRTIPTVRESPRTTTEIDGETANDGGTLDLRQAREREVEVELDLFVYQPTIIVTEGGEGAILIEMGNESNVAHTFTSEELGVDKEVGPLKQTGFLMRPPTVPGTYPFFCRFHAEQGMRGAIRVV